MLRPTGWTLPCLVVWLAALPAQAQVQDTILYNFNNPNGAMPQAGLTISGSTLYGVTTYTGGFTGDGTLFQIGTNGTGYSVLYTFTGGSSDGAYPSGVPTLVGSTLFGLTGEGGSYGSSPTDGTLYQIGTNGAGFGLVHQFGSGTDGIAPAASLALSGATLYGMTAAGGANKYGTVFSIGVDGSGYSVLHQFSNSPTDGANPYNGASPIVSGSTIYGATYSGGAANDGVIYKMNTDGSGFTLLHSFTGGAADGITPSSSLSLVGSTLYGTTGGGGVAGDGTIFSINTDGTGFQILHSFGATSGDGTGPRGDLAVVGSTLYGVTGGGGADALGTLFGINVDGSGYDSLYSFAGGTTDGRTPFGGVLAEGADLFGTTYAGGSFDQGTIYSFPIPVPEPSSFLLAAGAGVAFLLGRRGRRSSHTAIR